MKLSPYIIICLGAFTVVRGSIRAKNDRKIQCILKIMPVLVHGGTSSQLGFLTVQSFRTINEAFTVYYHVSGRIYGCQEFYPCQKMTEKNSVYIENNACTCARGF